MPILLLALMAVVFSALWHHFVATYSLAVFGATISTVVVFQVIVYLQLGYLDPFFLFALATSSGISLVIALLVGLPIRARRKARMDSTSRSGTSGANHP